MGTEALKLKRVLLKKKIKGSLPILGDDGLIKDPHNLSSADLLDSILRWSALPGFSRHHWGTDFDIYDQNTLPTNYKIQLIPEEYQKGGPFQKLNKWIDKLSSSKNEFSLFLPYKKDLGGVAKEPWHISFSTLTPQYEETLTFEFFKDFIQSNEIPLKKAILERPKKSTTGL